MQILNISVQNRPSKSSTSRPYPIDFIESIDMVVEVSAQQDNYNIQEDTTFSAGFVDCLVRELLTHLKIKPETTSIDAGIMDVQITKGVAYLKVKMDITSTEFTVGFMDVVQSRWVEYISTRMDTELTATTAGIMDIRITK